jgi:hypothetical protein
MAMPVRRTMNHAGAPCKPVLAGFGFSLLVRLTEVQCCRDQECRNNLRLSADASRT